MASPSPVFLPYQIIDLHFLLFLPKTLTYFLRLIKQCLQTSYIPSRLNMFRALFDFVVILVVCVLRIRVHEQFFFRFFSLSNFFLFSLNAHIFFIVFTFFLPLSVPLNFIVFQNMDPPPIIDVDTSQSDFSNNEVSSQLLYQAKQGIEPNNVSNIRNELMRGQLGEPNENNRPPPVDRRDVPENNELGKLVG